MAIQGGHNVPLNRNFLEAYLEASAENIHIIITAARCEQGRLIIIELAIIQHEANIVDRRPDQRCLIAVLNAADDTSIDQIKMIITNVELERAKAALIDWILTFIERKMPSR